MKKLILSFAIVFPLLFSSCATFHPVTDPTAEQKITWQQHLKDSADKFAEWIVTDTGRYIATSVMTLMGDSVFILVPDDVLSPSTKKTLADEMWGISKMFRSLQTGTLTPAQLDASIKTFGPNVSSERYAQYFALLNQQIKFAVTKLQGKPAALNAFLECAAKAAEAVAASYGSNPVVP